MEDLLEEIGRLVQQYESTTGEMLTVDIECLETREAYTWNGHEFEAQT